MGLSNRTIKGKYVLVSGGAGFIGCHLTVIDNFFLGILSDITKAYHRMPTLQIMHLDASYDCAVYEEFSKLERVDVESC
jgi:hypothetical protein